MERRLANVLAVGVSLAWVLRWGWSFAKDEELNERANEEDDRKLTDEKALGE